MALTHTKICIICGASFDAPPSSKKVTCSDACSAERKRATHTGSTYAGWSNESKRHLTERGQTSNLRLGTLAAQLSPIAGPFETNQEAKIWWLLNQTTRERYTVRNLRKFCRDNAELFDPDPWENAYAGLRQVQACLMGKTKRGVSRWKDWTLERPAQAPQEGDNG